LCKARISVSLSPFGLDVGDDVLMGFERDSPARRFLGPAVRAFNGR
jgi:hypothetical protein